VSTWTRAARLVPDEHRAGAERVTARAALRWPPHPRAIGAADQIADCGHETNHPRVEAAAPRLDSVPVWRATTIGEHNGESTPLGEENHRLELHAKTGYGREAFTQDLFDHWHYPAPTTETGLFRLPPARLLGIKTVLGNGNAVPADLTSVMMKRVIWLIFLSLTFVFIVTAVAGPVVTVIACAGLGLFTLPEARGVLSLFFVFIVTAAAGPVLAVVGCIAVLIYALAEARGDAVRRAEAEAAEAEAAAAEAKAAAEAVIAEAEAVIAAARVRLFGEAGS
jgi:hypothetical protein